MEALKPILNKIGSKLISHAVEILRSTDNITVLIATIISHEIERRNVGAAVAIESTSSSLKTKIKPDFQPSKFPANDNDFDTFLSSLTMSNNPQPIESKKVVDITSNQRLVPNLAKSSHVNTKNSAGDDDDFLEFLKDDTNFLS